HRCPGQLRGVPARGRVRQKLQPAHARAHQEEHQVKRTWTEVGVGILATIGAVYLGFVIVMPLSRYAQMHGLSGEDGGVADGKWQAEQVQETCSDDHELKTVVWVSGGTPVSVGGRQWSAFRAVSSQPRGPAR